MSRSGAQITDIALRYKEQDGEDTRPSLFERAFDEALDRCIDEDVSVLDKLLDYTQEAMEERLGFDRGDI